MVEILRVKVDCLLNDEDPAATIRRRREKRGGDSFSHLIDQVLVQVHLYVTVGAYGKTAG